MLSRRQFLTHTLQGSALLAVGAAAPRFLASTALAAAENASSSENILVVVEMAGGNDGLNTVVPYGDDLYHKARPTLRIAPDEVIRIDDHIGLNPGLRPLESLLENNRLAIIQGVGYPNPNRSHFESMDIWQTADPRRKISSGWLGRSISLLDVKEGRIPAFHIAKGDLPLAFEGASTGVPSLHPDSPFDLQLGGRPELFTGNDYEAGSLQSNTGNQGEHYQQRRQLVSELTQMPSDPSNAMLQFVHRTALDTYATIDQLREILNADFEKPIGDYERVDGNYRYVRDGLAYELQLVARMIQADFGTRVYYVSLDGFDTHSSQKKGHEQLLNDLGNAISRFYSALEESGNHKRVVLMTFSEFGRRVEENGSQGTDHGSASCMFVAGPGVKGGLIGAHPSLAPDKLASGDLKYHTDFRQVYATILDRWLACDSRRVLDEPFPHLDLIG